MLLEHQISILEGFVKDHAIKILKYIKIENSNFKLQQYFKILYF